ncbi:hypothetical protein [Actinoplanes sp. NPDC049118]|uniref:hypothetical protein n=1 Tax=Actinoplanes sp. NPDC049118 TaxID=3155769 RepID=UPI0033CB54E3
MTIGYLFSAVVGHLPMLAVLVVGFAVVASRKAQLDARSVQLARLGLGALVLGSVVQLLWSLFIPMLLMSVDHASARYGGLSLVVGLTTSVAFAGGVGLLVAALVTRGRGQAVTEPPVQAFGGEFTQGDGRFGR